MPQEQTAAPMQVTPQEFAAKIKTKYPVYASVPDDQLVEKITAKYPQYKSQIKQAAPAVAKVGPDPQRGAAQATGLGPDTRSSAGKIWDEVKRGLTSAQAGQGLKPQPTMTANAAQFAGMAGDTIARLGIAPEGAAKGTAVEGAIGKLFKPTTTTVPELSKLVGPTGKPLFRMVEQEGPSAAQRVGQKVVTSIKAVPKWMKENPVKAIGVEIAARELGVDPIQLAHKLLKYGGGLVP